MRTDPRTLAFCALCLLIPPLVQAQNGSLSINVRSHVTTRVPVPNDACTVPQSNSSFLTTDPRVWVVFSYTGGNSGDSGQLEFLSPGGG